MLTMGQQKRIAEQEYAESLEEQRLGIASLNYIDYDLRPTYIGNRKGKEANQAIVRHQYQGNCPDDV